jgi:hypothetical protein
MTQKKLVLNAPRPTAHPVPSKKCSKCEEVKSLSEFSRNSAARDGHLSRCKVCKAEYDRLRWDANRDELLVKNRQRYHEQGKLWKYGITNEQWAVLFEKQGECCSICKTKSPNKNQWCTDHDHATGQVRGILCHHCNRALGLLGDSSSNLLSALEYLRNPPFNNED